MGWRCRSCRSWDIYAATLGDNLQIGKSGAVWKKGQGDQSHSLGRGEIASSPNLAAFKPTLSGGLSGKASCSKVSRDKGPSLSSKRLDAASPCANQFQALRENQNDKI